MNQLELLSPAGDLDIFKAVINEGADAVYFGGDLFGARAYAKNFSIEEAAEAIKYAHLHGAKAYLTVNTLLKNLEIEKKLYDYLRAYVENGIDAFIVQDMGVFQLISDFFPDTHIHASTQMSLCTPQGASFIEKMGASRIVTARELSISEIADINKACPDLEIESFIHGALCVCYSGQCLMSSILGGRSGNRGRCAQPCRLPYEMYDSSGKKVSLPGNYLLSPKDFCTIENLPEMIEAGVMSFKIEGRMKKMNYAASVVRVYRHYIDEYLYHGTRNYKVLQEDMQKLLNAGNRSGFTDLYLHNHNGKELITFEAPSHTKADEEKVLVSEKKLKINCRIMAKQGKPFSLKLYDNYDRQVLVEGAIVDVSIKKPTSKEEIIKAVSQLGNTSFEIEGLYIDYDDDIFLPVSVIKKVRREAVEKYEELLLSPKDANVIDFEEEKEEGNKRSNPGLFVCVETLNQLERVAQFPFVDAIAVPVSIAAEAINHYQGRIYIKLPDVLRGKFINELKLNDNVDGVIASSIDELGFLESVSYPKDKIIIDHRLYTYSNRSLSSFKRKGFKTFCAPYELSAKELMHRDNGASQMIIYSRIPMMITANCSLKNSGKCNHQGETYSLTDRKNEKFPVKCNCDFCYNTIYNSKVFMAFDMKDDILNCGFETLRIDFTTENDSQIKEVLLAYEAVFINNRENPLKGDFTKGHLKRGVE